VQASLPSFGISASIQFAESSKTNRECSYSARFGQNAIDDDIPLFASLNLSSQECTAVYRRCRIPPMLTTYRRHREDCAHKSEGRKYRRCRCPIWVDGFIGQREIRRATGLRDWEKAQTQVRDWEAEGQDRAAMETLPITISEAKEEFLHDAEARNLRDKTIYKYRLLFGQLEEFTEVNGIRLLRELDAPILRKFRATWKDGNLAALKKLERLRTFFRFALGSKWITENPTTEIRSPRVSARPTLPFTHDEMIGVLRACDDLFKSSCKSGKANMLRMRALILMLRYSGMRIGDAVSCAVERLNGKKLLLYTQKTGVPVYCPLPDFVVSALEAIPPTSERYFSGQVDRNSKPRPVIGKPS
jgi:integrase